MKTRFHNLLLLTALVAAGCTGGEVVEITPPTLAATSAATETPAPTPAFAPTPTLTLLTLGWAALAEGDLEQAEQIAEQILAEDPENGEAWALRGMSQPEQDDGAPLVEALEKARQLGYENPAILERLGMLYLHQRESTWDLNTLLESTQRTREVLTRLQQLDPASALASDHLPDLARDADLGTDVSGIAPDAVEHFQSAEKYFAQGEYEKAIPEYEAAIEIAPDFGLAILYLGDVYYQQQRYEEAIPWFQRTVEANPGLVQGWTFLGDSYKKIRLGEHARTAYIQALTLLPSDKTARHGFETLGQAMTEWEDSYFRPYGFRLVYPSDVRFEYGKLFGKPSARRGDVMLFAANDSYLLSLTWQPGDLKRPVNVAALSELVTHFLTGMPGAALVGVPREFQYGATPMVYQLYELALPGTTRRNAGAAAVWLCDGTLFVLQLELGNSKPETVPANLFPFLESFRCRVE